MQFKATGEVKINIAVLAYSNKILWDCRNFLYAFMDKTKCNLGITLTKNVDVIFRGMKFMPGGFDLVVVADVFVNKNMTNLSIPLQKIPIIQESSFLERNTRMLKAWGV